MPFHFRCNGDPSCSFPAEIAFSLKFILNLRMPNWMFKSKIHRAISILPCSSTWNELFQRVVTRSLDLGAGGFQGQLEHCRAHLDHYLALQKEKNENFTVLEIGTGWCNPTSAMGLYLCGQRLHLDF